MASGNSKNFEFFLSNRIILEKTMYRHVPFTFKTHETEGLLFKIKLVNEFHQSNSLSHRMSLMSQNEVAEIFDFYRKCFLLCSRG